ncbi:shikimate kinase [Novosphingobium sp. PS1R-30]|uniref:Shikimate kinase n=1 Tax=Novosphingobium anseongense TaxID=3133436 RepID=A0ABU8RSY6_9SPHN|nr:MAG: shikimate kinase [Novosphingobium sp.]
MDVEDSQLSTGEIEAMARRIDRPVVLVGMMGVGKSSVGKRLATLFHWPFVDADDEIERAAQMSIPEIFATHGEAYFRDGERRVIARLIQQEGPNGSGARRVIATGGGAFVNPETRSLILERAIAVWLDSDIDTLIERTARKDNRPLLQQGDPRETLTRLRDERREAYAQAPIHVVSGSGPHGRTIAKVLQGIGQWL